MELYIDKNLINEIKKYEYIDVIQIAVAIGNETIDEEDEEKANIKKYQAIAKTLRKHLIIENKLGDEIKKQYFGFENYLLGTILADIFDIDVEAKITNKELINRILTIKEGK